MDQKDKKIRKIVTVQNQDDAEMVREAIRTSGGHIVKELPLVGGYLCEFPEDNQVSIAVRGLEDKVRVEEDLDFKLCYYSFLPLFPFFPKPKPADPRPQPEKPQKPQIRPNVNVDWGIKRIGAPQIWSKLTDRRVRVGIIDTGIDYNHPDLSSGIKQCISTLDDNLNCLDDYGHGTHVAGTIGASSNRYGMVGINPYVDFYSVKAFDKSGNGKLSDIVEGIDWLIRQQVNVINMSFSTQDTNSVLTRAINAAYSRGIVLVAAAGNDGGEDSVRFPARYPDVIAVSATNEKDRIADFSSTGPEVDFCAPGDNIRSTWIRGGYERKSGTSFAAPHITGTVADLINYYGFMPPQQIKLMMSERAVPLESLSKEQQGSGLVEIPRLIQ